VEHLGLLLAPLAMFMFVSSITPGPNNLMLLGSGIRFGFGRTIPHMLGIVAGMVLLLLVCYAGVGALLLAAPGIGKLLTLLCALYLLWLALGLLRAAEPAPADASPGEGTVRGRPMRAWEAVLFQFANPKAWAMAVTACAIAGKYPLGTPLKLALLLSISALVNLPSISIWALFGKALRGYLHTPAVRQAFNLAMSALVVATALWMLAPLLDGSAAAVAVAQDPAYLLGR
jgi:threonine/homoserine/homoserine lactone efflux protein